MVSTNEGGGSGDVVGVAALFVGVVSVGAAAILVRLADAHPLTTTFLRLAIGGAVLTLMAVVSRRALPRGPELRRALGAGVLLAAHFALWIASLSLTSVTASVVLVCLQPVFVAVLGRVFLGESVAKDVAAGIAIALVGAVVLASDGAGSNEGGFVGDVLALAGAVAIALYVLVLRKQRGDVLATSAVVTSTAAVVALPLCLLWQAPLWPSSSTQGWWLVALAIGPQVIGHTALNAALKRLPAAVVSGSILGEPVIASGLAFVVLDEQPGWRTAVGALITLVGLVLLLRRR